MKTESAAPDQAQEPLVSCIIVFLNAASFIDEAIASVFAQTHTAWELLLVDDGSTDASSDIALRYAAELPGKVRYLAHEGKHNRGISASRNLGIQFAQGEYIAFLDADDVWQPHKLEEQLAILEANPEVAMVFGPILYWHSWTGKAEDSARDYMPALAVPSGTPLHPPDFLTLMLADKLNPVPSVILLRRSAFERAGYFVPEFPGMLEDRAFYTKLGLFEVVMAAGGDYWLKYRIHPQSLSFSGLTGRVKKLNYLRQYFSWAQQYLVSLGLRHDPIWETFKQAELKAVLRAYWKAFLDEVIALGRQSLPQTVRHKLWMTIGRRLYLRY